MPEAQRTIPNGFQPEIYIDENGIFQIKYVRRAGDGKHNGTISIETFAMNAISPIANNASQQHTNTSSSINTESDETAINSYDDQQFELDVRFEGPNIKDSNRDNYNNITITTTIDNGTINTDNTTRPHNDINVNMGKSIVNITAPLHE